MGAVGMVSTGCNMALGCLGHVLFIPCLGCFICPLAVPGLAFRYFVLSFLVILGHPLRKPFLVAFNNVEIFGLHKDWCANLTALACVCTECVKVARFIPG